MKTFIVGLLTFCLTTPALAWRNQAELNMLDSAGRANMYENYLTALSYYNANTRSPVTPLSRDQWAGWRAANSLEALR
jgi:hypothetical protein